ncbi:MAG: hypothetical protein KatS3mg090_0449 [Patescibacteria group bacterium]|nr:MAG: hypothetical protein KatS3mg090_0449 [Patescibacteria group bacterium]
MDLVSKKERGFFKYDDSLIISIYTVDLFDLNIPAKTDFYYKTKGFLYILKYSWDKIVKYYFATNPDKIREIFEKNIGYEEDIKCSYFKISAFYMGV